MQFEEREMVDVFWIPTLRYPLKTDQTPPWEAIQYGYEQNAIIVFDQHNALHLYELL